MDIDTKDLTILSTYFDEHPSQITPNLFLGNKISTYNNKFLKEIGISHIINIGDKLKINFPNDYNYLSIDIKDSNEELIYHFFNPVFEFVDKAVTDNGKVLFHCHLGISRSSAFMCAYLMKKNSINFNNALSFIKSKRLKYNQTRVL